MLFVKTKDLKQGMRLAKPIYSKKGVLLYGRDTRLTEQVIASVKNFALIGVYILEPAEPLPPMSDEDIEFERFQTMAVYTIREDLQAIINQEQPDNLYKMADLIMTTYGREKKKINFTQNLRSPSDYVYKHSLNVAILSVLIARTLNESTADIRELVVAALLHDLGLLLVNEKVACSDEPDEEEKNNIKKAIQEGYNLLDYANVSQNIKRNVAIVQRTAYDLGSNIYEGRDKNLSTSAKILMLADKYDKMTAMKIDVEPESEFVVIKKLMNDTTLDSKVVNALISSINILVPGVCVELTNGEKGLVLIENESNILKPTVLGFNNNRIYILENTNDSLQIKDIMKTMDNRTVIDKNTLMEYI
jgi:5'-deoxynucleotidase YfbR-like HD superfamily hydrolase